MTRTITSYLVVKADGGMRIRQSAPSVRELAFNEVYFTLVVRCPDNWRKPAGTITLDVPEGAVDVSGDWGGVGGRDPLEELLIDADELDRARVKTGVGQLQPLLAGLCDHASAPDEKCAVCRASVALQELDESLAPDVSENQTAESKAGSESA